MAARVDMDQRQRIALYDAHNHLQDERLNGARPAILQVLRDENVRRMVVNGSCEEDWPALLDLAQLSPQVIPSFGYHPWYVKERSENWLGALESFLGKMPSGVGEIGLDRWIKDYDWPAQEGAFIAQLRLAAERNLPVSIHCLEAWGRLLELLQAGPRPACGFVLHSFGGPEEMLEALTRIGAYFSLPGYFAHERKARQRQAFRNVPSDRLLIETDAPDQLLPPERVLYLLQHGGKAINHPANLRAVYEFAAELRGQPLESLARQVEENFHRIFGGILR